jgi:hypothetical protein
LKIAKSIIPKVRSDGMQLPRVRTKGILQVEQRKIRSAANAIAAFIFHLPRINNHCSRAMHFEKDVSD